MDYRYKCVPAPKKAKRTREHRTDAEALVAAMEAAIAVEAAQGWEYLRTDVVPMETRKGLFSAASETHQGVMVFRRPASPRAWDDEPAPRRREDARPAFAPQTRDEDGPAEIPRLGAARVE
jgi:hypothetical protein